MDKLIAIAATLAIITVSTGQLPKVIYKVQMAQLYLIKGSQASNWGRLPLLPVKK
ncbi:MAG TPA: hypothetical protein VI754_08855 [Bacteriovoracaceae bacterium]|nr:hypothetical protein [Bacteriovoracaceae bacterium]